MFTNTPNTKNETKENFAKKLNQLLRKGFTKRVSKSILKYNISVIDDDNGADYMGDFMKDFPKNTLLNKVKTGIGATTMALRHKDKYVIAVPFIDLASNKREWCVEEKIDVLVINSDTTSEEIQNYTGNKIIAIYDSLYKVSRHIKNFESFRIMIDEAHILLLSGTFRKRAIYIVFNEYKKYKDYVFLTATIPSRMYDMDEFKKMNKAIINWKHNPQPTFLTHIVPPYDEQLKKTLYAICIEHLYNTRTSNAYIFINSVRAIKSIVKLLIKKENATAKSINIIASSSNKEKIKKELGKEFSEGKAPRNTESAKKLNFITSTGFEGQDFYDSNGKTYIVSDGSFDFMKLDLLTQVPQIVGRLRDSNLNNEIPLILKPNEVDESQTLEMFEDCLKSNLSTAKKLIILKNEALLNSKVKFNGKDNYSITTYNNFIEEVRDKPEYYVDSNKKVSTNKYYLNTNLNKRNVEQQGVLAVYNEEFGLLQAKYSEMFEITNKYVPSHNIPEILISNRIKEVKKLNKLKELILKSIELIKEWENSNIGKNASDIKIIDSKHYAYYTPDWIKKAYFTIGESKMAALSYSKAKIEVSTNEYLLHKLVPDKLNLEIGEWYLNSDLKRRIQKAYDSVGISDRAKSTNIPKYYDADSCMRTISKERKNGYLIKSKIIM